MRDEVTSFDAPNPRLWVRLVGNWTPDPDLHWLIAGSAQTHRAHFHVCSATGDLHRSVNFGDVAETSPEAALWLDGFIEGQQADMWEFLGADDALFEAADEADEQRLDEWNREFRRNGYGPPLHVLPPRDARLSDLGPPRPWCYVGGLYRVWADDDWTPADPQPVREHPSGWFWPGSVCAQSGEHKPADDENIDYCERCHHVTA